MRIVVASLVLLAAFLGVMAGGYFYLNRVAVGFGRVPVMFPAGPAAHRPAPGTAGSHADHRR